MKKTAYITEPRKHKALKFVLENVLSVLPTEWSVQINHGTSNSDYIKKIIDDSSVISDGKSQNRIVLQNLNIENLEHIEESALSKSEKFWNSIDGDLLLKFECDTMLCPNSEYKITQFEKYDFIGGYWGRESYPLDEPYPKQYPMNGGLSLRKKDTMIYLIKNHLEKYTASGKSYSDDYFFSEYIDKPITRDVRNFSIDNGYIEPLDMKAPFGVHKPWGTTPSKGHGRAYDKIKEVCPEVEVLKSLQSVEHDEQWWEK
jgi:hypothetical protein